MRKYIDSIRVCNNDLAHILVESLEKKGEYSVDYFEQGDDPERMRRGGIELKVYRNEKVVHATPIGLKTEEKV